MKTTPLLLGLTKPGATALPASSTSAYWLFASAGLTVIEAVLFEGSGTAVRFGCVAGITASASGPFLLAGIAEILVPAAGFWSDASS